MLPDTPKAGRKEQTRLLGSHFVASSMLLGDEASWESAYDKSLVVMTAVIDCSG